LLKVASITFQAWTLEIAITNNLQAWIFKRGRLKQLMTLNKWYDIHWYIHIFNHVSSVHAWNI